MSRNTYVAAALITCALALAGCGILEPTRDSEGHITMPTVMQSTDALVGDCFNFVDGSDLSRAIVVSCLDEHSYIVLSRGKFSETKILIAGGLENAVTEACTDSFAAFKKAAPDDADPQQERIVSTQQKAGGKVTYYSCLSTD